MIFTIHNTSATHPPSWGASVPCFHGVQPWCSTVSSAKPFQCLPSRLSPTDTGSGRLRRLRRLPPGGVSTSGTSPRRGRMTPNVKPPDALAGGTGEWSPGDPVQHGETQSSTFMSGSPYAGFAPAHDYPGSSDSKQDTPDEGPGKGSMILGGRMWEVCVMLPLLSPRRCPL